jgi:cytochrome P450
MLRYIAQNPEIQEQLITELDSEFQSSDVVLEDVTNIQFLTACFYETLRLTSSAIVPHMTNKDTSVGGNIFLTSCLGRQLRHTLLTLIPLAAKHREEMYYFFIIAKNIRTSQLV